jgi:hypothetical protein
MPKGEGDGLLWKRLGFELNHDSHGILFSQSDVNHTLNTFPYYGFVIVESTIIFYLQ